MDDVLFSVHQMLGYALTVVVLVTAMVAFGRAKNGQEFTAGLYRAVYGVLALHVLLGIALYTTVQAWEADALIAYVHPLLALAALGVGHALVGRASKQQQVVDAHRTAGRGLLIALVLVLTGIVVATIG